MPLKRFLYCFLFRTDVKWAFRSKPMTKNYCLAILYNNRTEGREGSCVFFGIFLSLSFAPFCYWRRKLQRLEMNSAALKRKMETQYNNTSQISSITGGWTQLGDSKVLAPGDFHVHKSRVCAAVHCTQQTPVELKPAPSGGSSFTFRWKQLCSRHSTVESVQADWAAPTTPSAFCDSNVF